MRNTRIAALLLIGAVASTSLTPAVPRAEIYKWVDADGRLHFTDEPPAERGTKVELDVAKPSAIPDEGEIRRLELVQRVQLEAKEKAVTQQKVRAPKQSELTNDSPGCRPARNRWYALTQDIPVYWVDSDTIRAFWHGDTYRGDRDYISDDERPALLRKTANEIEAYCPNGDIDDDQDSQYAAWLRNEDCLVSRARLELAMKDSSRTTKSELANIKSEVREFCG